MVLEKADMRLSESDLVTRALISARQQKSVVTASLIHAKKIFGDAIEIKSDGNWDDWDSGKVLYETVFDIQPESVIA
jgi:hypothetical protein